jgi:hypothetical protein
MLGNDHELLRMLPGGHLFPLMKRTNPLGNDSGARSRSKSLVYTWVLEDYMCFFLPTRNMLLNQRAQMRSSEALGKSISLINLPEFVEQKLLGRAFSDEPTQKLAKDDYHIFSLRFALHLPHCI